MFPDANPGRDVRRWIAKDIWSQSTQPERALKLLTVLIYTNYCERYILQFLVVSFSPLHDGIGFLILWMKKGSFNNIVAVKTSWI